MEVTYFNFLIYLLIFILGIASLIFLVVNKKGSFSGLSVVALLDALMAIINSALSVYSMLSSDNLCNSRNLLLHQSTILMTFINGLLSTVLWNYQSWNKIKLERKTNVSTNSYMVILPQYLILTLIILYILKCEPEKYIGDTENKPDFTSKKMLAFINEIPCPNNFSNESLILFDSFLQDINKSRSDIVLYGNYSTSADIEEVVRKIYELVYEKINASNVVATEINSKRAPRAQQKTVMKPITLDDIKLSNNSITFTGEFDYSLNDYTVDNNTSTVITYNNNTWKLNFTGSDSIELSNDQENIKEETSFRIPKEGQSFGNLTNHTFLDEEWEIVQKDILERIFNDSESYLSFLQYDSNNITITDKQHYLNKYFDRKCFMMCKMEDHDEKVLLCLLLFFCYMMPVCYAVLLYGKASTEAVRFIEQIIVTKHEALLRSARWGLIMLLMLLTPLFLGLFMESMLDKELPEWLSTVLHHLSQVHPLGKNVINILTIRKCSSIEGCNKIHPALDEDESDVVIGLPEIVNKEVTEAWVLEK